MQTSKLFDEILTTFKEKINGGGVFKEKFRIYSAHDLNVMAILTTLKLSNHSCLNESYYNSSINYTNCAIFPTYSSLIRFELHKEPSTGNYSIKFIYNNYTYDICYDKTLKNSQCKFSDFEALMKENIITDDEYDTICSYQ